MDIFNKRRIILLLIIVIASITITSVLTLSINSNNKKIFKSKSKALNTVADEYTSLNNRLDSLNDILPEIGTFKYSYPSNTTSVGLNSWTSIASLTLETGTWLVVGCARFPTNNSGFRQMYIYDMNDRAITHVTAKAATNVNTVLNNAIIIDVEGDSSTVEVYAQSYATLNTTGRIQAIKLK